MSPWFPNRHALERIDSLYVLASFVVAVIGVGWLVKYTRFGWRWALAALTVSCVAAAVISYPTGGQDHDGQSVYSYQFVVAAGLLTGALLWSSFRVRAKK